MYHMDLSDSVGPNRLPKQAFALSRSHLSADQVVLKISLTDYTQRKRMHVRFKIQLGLESHQALASKLWRRHLNLAQTRKTRRWLLAKAEKNSEEWILQNQDRLRAAPLAAGGLGVLGVVLNRAVSGAVGLDASSTESRTDVIIIALSAVLLLTGLQWLALRPVEKEAVDLQGKDVEYAHSSLSSKAVKELNWAYEALAAATRCRALVVFFKDTCILYKGKAETSADPSTSKPGPICQRAMEKEQGNYLANLALYPGRFEFLEYFPSNTQGVIVKPIGKDGVLVVAADTQRGFGNVDQAWLSRIAEKLDSTLDGYVPSGRGFKQSVGASRAK